MARAELTSRTLGRSGEQTAPLSFAQQQIWLMDQVAPGDPSYALPVAYRLRGPLNVALLEGGLRQVVRRHEILRTTFHDADGEPVQRVHEFCDIALKVIDLSAHPESGRIETVKALASAEVRVLFNLEQLPLLRVTLFRLNDEDHILLINLHHIVADGMSFALLLDELHAEYTSGADRGSERPELPIQYRELARKQRLDSGSVPESDLAFWRRYLDGIMPLELPLDMARPPVQSFDGRNAFFDIPLDLVNELTALGAREGCTLSVTLLAAFAALLSRYSGSEDFAVGMPVALRSTPGVESLIGNFLNVLPLRCDLHREPSFLQLLRRTRASTFRAFSRAAVPFPHIVESVSAHRDASRNPIFQVMFELLPGPRPNIGPLAADLFEFELGYAQFDLSLHVWEQPDRYACRLEYCTRLFTHATVARMASNFVRLLREIVANPERAVCRLDILAEPERSFVLGGNAPAPSVAQAECVHHVIERVAGASPDMTALVADRVALTYRELSERSNRLANHLIAIGVRPGDLVGVCLERSVHLPIALLAILKAGAAYVPLDPLFPAERLAYMLDDARVSVLVTQSSLRGTVPGESSRTIVSIDEHREGIQLRAADLPCVPVSRSDLAYTIYTSGSSGKPKGVMIEHGALTNFLRSMQAQPGFTAGDVLVSVTTISFDIAGLEIFLPLVSGARLVIATKQETLDGCLLLDLLHRNGATVLQATPSTWKLLLDAEWSGTPGLKMLCGGEPLPQTLADALVTRGRELWNMYGPTETTIWSSALRLVPGAPVLIGAPIANTRFYVVDQYLEPAPVGVSGELLIGGDGLARGYLGRDDLTSDRFITWSRGGSSERVYRTGDRVRLLPNGCYEFLGRLDFQVKLRGYRIELGEIEHALARHDAVEAAVVMVRRDRTGDDRLVAYYKPRTQLAMRSADLRAHLQASLPDYMCPAVYVEMEQFPLTANGKIDRKAFPEPGIVDGETNAAYTAPVGDVEMKLAMIWERILNRQRIGANEDFFEIGGHSLMAARLFLQLQRDLGVKLPLALLFQAPTIRELAKRIEGTGWRSNWRSLVPIRSSGTRAPLFLVHGAEGNVLLYRNLAAALRDDQPVYGLQARGLDGTKEQPETIEQMAEAYVSELRMVQPHGPYYLGGYCLGGTIALEMAQQLERAGERVAFVALLETYNIQVAPRNGWALRCLHAVQNASYQLRNVCLGAKGGGIRFVREKMQVELSRLRVRLHVWYAGLTDRLGVSTEQTYDHVAIVERTHYAQAAYAPSPYAGQLVLFRPRVHFKGMSDPFFGWGQIAGGQLRVVELPNFPHGSLNTPFVSFVATHLRELMDASAAVSTAPALDASAGYAHSDHEASLVSRAPLSSVSL